MAGIGNNLYPPIIATYMPAFVRTNSCNVYFSLSSYNTSEEINEECVQVMVSYQNSSLSALSYTAYPTGIMLTNLKVGDKNNEYYITIHPSDLENFKDSNGFEVGEYYKVQIRFTGKEATSPDINTPMAEWLVQNQNYFSEWSTICLIKGIEQPKIYLNDFSDIEDFDDKIFTSEVVTVVGEMYYEQNADLEDEYLKQYEINIYSMITGETVYSSDIIYTNEFYPNEINYTLTAHLDDGIKYLLELTYTTNNGYSNNVAYYFVVVIGGEDTFDATITAEVDTINGRIGVHLLDNTPEPFFGNVCISRTSSETNYTVWEDLKIITFATGSALDYTWYDYTPQGGIYYQYCARKISSKGNRGSAITLRKPVMLYLNDMFLTGNDFQLNIKYNPGISSFKTTISESKTDTIGSKYPYITRNGNVYYKQFPITGLITGFCDEDRLFSSRQEFFGDSQEYYDIFNDDEHIDDYNDFVYEKFFRDKVMNFLYKNDVKLFRSLTEGNVLVKLMDISFTPNQTLGRRLYNFSATAYEVAECNIDNYNHYNLIDTGTYSEVIQYTYSSVGQLSETCLAGQNIMTLIQKHYRNLAPEGYYNIVTSLSWVRITFESDPYLILCGADGSLTPVTSDMNVTDLNNIVYGYIVYIDGDAILVSSRGFYELKDEDTFINSIYFPIDTEVLIDYIAIVEETEDASKVAQTLSYYNKVGQMWGTFDIDTPLFSQIYMKYYLNYSTYYYKLLSIDTLTVETIPNAILYVKDSFDDDFCRHEVGRTGVLKFDDDETTLSSFYFCGVHLYPYNPEYNRTEVEDGKYFDTGLIVTDVNEIENPIKNGVYTITNGIEGLKNYAIYMNVSNFDANCSQYQLALQEYYQLLVNKLDASNNRYIYYHDTWYVFSADDDVLCPVSGLLDYTYESVKGEY